MTQCRIILLSEANSILRICQPSAWLTKKESETRCSLFFLKMSLCIAQIELDLSVRGRLWTQSCTLLKASPTNYHRHQRAVRCAVAIRVILWVWGEVHLVHQAIDVLDPILNCLPELGILVPWSDGILESPPNHQARREVSLQAKNSLFLCHDLCQVFEQSNRVAALAP